MTTSGIEREPVAIGRGVVAGALVDDSVPQSEPEAAGGWLNSLSPKAFKGKGVLWELRRATEDLARTDYLMQELVAMTRTVRSRELALAALRYKTDGRVVVRWKRVGASRTIRFEEAAETWGRYAEPLRSWYATASGQAEMLNLRHRLLMARIRTLRAQLPVMPVFPRGAANGIQLHALAQERLADFVAKASVA